MVSSRASQPHNAMPSDSLSQPFVSNFSPAAESGSQALFLIRDARWIVGATLLYLVAVVATVFTLHAYFSQTWDVVTFIGAGKTILSPEWNTLYGQSRAANYWPYAYPPLHAFVVAPFLALSWLAPDFLLVRVPPMLFDVALGVLLYAIVARKTKNKILARLAMLVWLLNPVTWYDTAVQGHFEAEWLFFVVLAYYLSPDPSPTRRGEMDLISDLSLTRRGEMDISPDLSPTRRGSWIFAMLALSVAFLFKQNAILFALPLWAMMLFGTNTPSFLRRGVSFLVSLVVFSLPILLVSLPFVLYSNDYWYMNVQYVADVPLQTQSWLVALAGLFGADNLFLRASSPLTLIAVVVISIVAARRGMNVWLTATLIVLAFFLLSKKVVGYYYVMLLPFALVTLVPTKHFRLLSLIVVFISFVSLSPYFASWTNPSHVWWYSALGIFNSAVWAWIFVRLWRGIGSKESGEMRELAFLSFALFLSAVAAALLQPFINSQASPIRAPLIANGMETQALFSFLAFSFLVSLALIIAVFFTRSLARAIPVPKRTYALVVLLAPLYFLTFTLTKESTMVFELILGFFNS